MALLTQMRAHAFFFRSRRTGLHATLSGPGDLADRQALGLSAELETSDLSASASVQVDGGRPEGLELSSTIRPAQGVHGSIG